MPHRNLLYLTLSSLILCFVCMHNPYSQTYCLAFSCQLYLFFFWSLNLYCNEAFSQKKFLPMIIPFFFVKIAESVKEYQFAIFFLSLYPSLSLSLADILYCTWIRSWWRIKYLYCSPNEKHRISWNIVQCTSMFSFRIVH